MVEARQARKFYQEISIVKGKKKPRSVIRLFFPQTDTIIPLVVHEIILNYKQADIIYYILFTLLYIIFHSW